jgi:hypothetical protein
MEQKKEHLEIKDLELLLWAIPGIIFVISVSISHGFDYFSKEPAIFLDLFFAFSPLLFAILFSVIYENFPISHLINLFKKEKTE